MRRLLSSDESNDSEKYYEIPSQYIILPASSISNINLLYIKFETATENEELKGDEPD